jgi:chromosome segregation ATPase
VRIKVSDKENNLKNILSILKEKNAELEQINKNLVKSKEIYDKEDKKREEYNKLKSLINILQNNSEEIKNQKKNISNSLDIISDKEKYLEKNNFIIEKEKTFSEELKNLSQIKNNFNQKKELEKNFQVHKNNLDLLIKQINSFSLIDITKDLHEKDDNLKNEEKKLNRILEEKINLENNILYLRREYEDLKKEFDDIKSLSGKATCPTCLRPLEEHYPNLLKLYEDKLVLKAKE